jgi:hypothetical protein
MKNLLLIFAIILFVILFTSCKFSSVNPEYTYTEDTLFLYGDQINDTITLVTSNKSITNIAETLIESKIEPIQTDSTYKNGIRIIKKDSTFKELEKTEKIIQYQQRKIDSLILKKSR